RVGGRVMLCAMRATYAVLAVLLMTLALTGRLTPAWVLVVAALAGAVRPNDLVMRNALIGETIPPAHLMNAVGLSRGTIASACVSRRGSEADARGLGWLVGGLAIGGLGASVTMVLPGGTRRPERAALVGTAIWYALLLMFAHLRSVGAGALTLLVAGFVQNVV